MNLKEKNGQEIGIMLDMIGNKDIVLKTDSPWELSISYADRTETSIDIEMAETMECEGDTMYDPFMEIRLALDKNGQVLKAEPLFYQALAPFSDQILYAKGNPDCYDPALYAKEGDLDQRLEAWLHNIRIQGYLSTEAIIRARN